ncbi:AraC-like DNA-binding protein [Hydrogenophaga palleronii]|uniref:AraC-like DNA-binding protein n=1 Tax=Hydrogenophaga palleronii TaxID=65655 RepID=A0ABU1WUE5_9BURK|nr:AraC family transcriptional regulator [Hydrogenophaga palleronii]MDR7152933.1 AraC-like DNA-binding protein [Hydrogenophaga palleronii]
MGGAVLNQLSVRAYGASHGSHDHGHFQVLVGLQGVLELEMAGRGQCLGAGQGCVVPPGERHDFESKLGAQCLVLDSTSMGWASAPSAPPAQVTHLATYLAHACAQGLPRAQQLGPALLLEAWQPEPGTVPRVRRHIDWDQLQRWAASRWSEPLSVSDLADQVHLSTAQFAARCRAELGMSTQQWLRSLRLEEAREWRRQGLSVAETARRTGYRSPSALTAALRRES